MSENMGGRNIEKMEEIPLFSEKMKLAQKAASQGKWMGRLQGNNEGRQGKPAQGF